MWDLLKHSDGLMGFGDGNCNINVEFRMIVFRPFKHEIITAKIKGSTPEGIYLTTDFFDNIFVPGSMLFEDCFYNEEEETWVWRTEEAEVFFDSGTTVHARIESESWQDAMQIEKGKAASVDEGALPSRVPYSIQASMAETGLGGVDWW